MSLRRRDVRVLAFCLLLAAACLLLCSKSSPLYPINDWEDANAYLSAGKGILAGRVMYRDLYEHKGPLIYMLHALCALISPSGFLGVFFMEIAAVGLFLMAVYKLLTLYGAGQSAWALLPLAAALSLSSVSFRTGDSAEELCLPVLAWALYFLLRWLKLRAPQRMPASALLLSGVACGFVLWMKFTMLGFFAAWILGLMLYHFLRRQPRSAFASLGWFLCGIGIATLPWFVYFAANGALYDWYKVYVYDNLFLYANTEPLTLWQRIRLMFATAWDFLTANPGFTLPTALGYIWFLAGRKQTAAEKLFVFALALLLGVGVFIGGKPYVYYGFIFAAFAALYLLPACPALDRALARKPVLSVLVAGTLTLFSLFFCYAASPNTKDLLKPREETMQYRFAAVIGQVPGATMLNYFFMDSGFYTAAGVTPTVKYFHYTNVPLPEMLQEQDRYIAQGVTDFVVTRGRQPDTITDRYTLVATEPATEGLWYDTVYLYERSDLLADD